MTNTEMLRQKVEVSGISYTFIAKAIGISRECLYGKVNNSTEFKASEIQKITQILRLTDNERDRIFFGD